MVVLTALFRAALLCLLLVRTSRSQEHSQEQHRRLALEPRYARWIRRFKTPGDELIERYDSYLFFSTGVVRKIPDPYTEFRLSHYCRNNVEDDEFMTEMELAGVYARLGPEVPSLAPRNMSHDELMRTFLDLIAVLQPPVISKSVYMGEMYNPAVADITSADHKTLMVYKRGKAKNACNVFSWLSADLDNTEAYTAQGIYQMGTQFNQTIVSEKAEDIRMIALPDPNAEIVSLIYSVPVTYGHRVMSSSLHLNSVTQNYEMGEAFYLHLQDERSRLRSHKNWQPFLYENVLHLIITLDPFVVVRAEGVEPEDAASGLGANIQIPSETLPNMKILFLPTVSTSPCKDVNNLWRFGELRGGTPAQLINDDFYLAFFHSKHKVKGSKAFTYVMGAYTFTKRPPFTLLKVSEVPMYSDTEMFYAGPQSDELHTDYVLYPMGFVTRSQTNTDGRSHETITLSIGRNDKEGWLVDIDLRTLLGTMIEVNCSSEAIRYPPLINRRRH